MVANYEYTTLMHEYTACHTKHISRTATDRIDSCSMAMRSCEDLLGNHGTEEVLSVVTVA